MNMNQADMICVDLKAKYKANIKTFSESWRALQISLMV